MLPHNHRMMVDRKSRCDFARYIVRVGFSVKLFGTFQNKRQIMKINEVLTKNIITKSNLPDADFVISPYIGCTHSCIYCYARFMKRFTGHKEKWGQFVDVKINSAETIPKISKKIKHKSVFMSSVTDPYLHIENKYQITRKILSKIVPLEPNLSIQIVPPDIFPLRSKMQVNSNFMRNI